MIRVKKRPIPGADDRYYATTDGNIWDDLKQKFLKQTSTGTGYLKVGLNLKSGLSFFLVHRLVALTFIRNPNKLPIVNHRDGNKHNNAVSNLEWASGAYNNYHASRYGLAYFKPRVDNHSGYVGISQDKNGSWRTYISDNKQRHYGGRFRELSEAIKSREELYEKYRSGKLTESY